MAAVTVTSRTDNVAGSLRCITALLTIAYDGDTWNTGLALITGVSFASPTNNAIGATVSGGTIAVQTGGTETGAYATVFGY